MFYWPPDNRGGSAERWLTTVLAVMVCNTVYLTWRFAALYAGWATPGTGLCSWSAGIDCDRVLQTPEARAFSVPNAVLGLGFYSTALLWWIAGRRLTATNNPVVTRVLVVGLSTASLASLWFWRLLLQLEALCPVCPWNHVLTYVALGFAARLRLKQKQRMSNENSGQLGQLAAVCVLWFLLCLAGWFFFEFSVEKATSAQ
jgi:uncharacterized membrane protein